MIIIAEENRVEEKGDKFRIRRREMRGENDNRREKKRKRSEV